MIKWVKNIKDNVLWSRSKGLVVYGPETFGHHFIYVDSNFVVALFLPKADKTLHILIGDLIKAKRWIKYDKDGSIIFDKTLAGNEHEWKIDKDRIRYRGTTLKPTVRGHIGKVIYSFDFHQIINDEWIKKKSISMYKIYEKGELPLTTNW